ncbi:hypothetical protein [Alloactinosynnema sp. L-07]|uniref:Rv0361 family membrane protein n=1 Tax=Alloactinosynnema sp. L-07 TaxID=1653480 RepID=UPI00065EFE9F|nr:hypothetical protein [Alloactinosynnema sp. L-07]CRK58324.1 hypothetical protein [Alloactinosynnema sp. L-07]
MSQPPQPPFGQADPYQGGYPQQGAFPQQQTAQPGYPQQGYPQVSPQQGHPQGDPHAGGYAQNQFGGPQQPYGYPQAYGAPQKRNSTPIIVAVAVLAVVGIGLTLFLTLGESGGSGGSARDASARDTAEKFVGAVRSKNPDAARALVCDEKDKSRVDESGAFTRSGFEVTLGDVSESGDTATATLIIKIKDKSTTSVMTLAKRSGDWCVDDVDRG